MNEWLGKIDKDEWREEKDKLRDIKKKTNIKNTLIQDKKKKLNIKW